jgi:hypothetical protein
MTERRDLALGGGVNGLEDVASQPDWPLPHHHDTLAEFSTARYAES